MGIAVWDEKNTCLPRDVATEWFDLLDIPVVNVLWRCTWDKRTIRSLHIPERDDEKHEGYVVRQANGFHHSDYGVCVVKYVRSQHVTTDKHWIYNPDTGKNGLAAGG